MQALRRFKLDEGVTAGRFRVLSEAAGPDASGRSIEQLARTIKANHALFGKVELSDATFQAFIRNFNENTYGQEIYLDRHHDISQGVMGRITKLFSRDGVLLAEVEWTSRGVKTWRDDGFKYFSIEFTDEYEHPETKKKHGPVLFGAALTPRPFIKNMKPTDGPGRLTLSEGRSVFVPDYLNLNEAPDMNEFLKRLRAALEAKKLSEALVTILLSNAETNAKEIISDAVKLKALEESIIAAAAPTAAVTPAPVQLTEAQINETVAKALAAHEEKSRTLAASTETNRKTFRDAIDGAKGLADETRTLLKQQAEAVTGALSADQVKALADSAIKMGQDMEVARQKFALGLMQAPQGSVLHVQATGNIGSQVHGQMREKLLLSEMYGNGGLRLPEEAKMTPFAKKVLAQFDTLHAAQLSNESKRLAGDGTTNIADGAFPVVAQRQVIIELLADLKFMQIVQTIVDPSAQATMQIPYELRNTAGIQNGAVVYEGQPIPYAGVKQVMDISYVLPRKIAMLMSEEMIHFARVAMINWDAWGRNISSNARLMRDIICAAIANEMQRASDLFGAVGVVGEVLTAQTNGARQTFKTAQFPVVRPYRPRDLQGNPVGTPEATITVNYAGGAINEYDGTNAQGAGNYYRWTDYNLGYLQIVNQLGVLQTPANATAFTVSYTYATNVQKFDIDVPGGGVYTTHLNGLLNAVGRRKALLQQQRFVGVQWAITSNTLHNTITEAEQFERNSEKNGSALDAAGDLASVKNIPFWGTNQPGIDLGDSRILMGERGTTSYGVNKPFVTGMPFEVMDPASGKPTAEKQAYGVEFSSIHTPLPIRNRMTSIVVFSQNARTAV